jgi:hypothetical protein
MRSIGIGDVGRLLVAEFREIASILCGSIETVRRCYRIEARLLFVTEGLIEALERGAYGLHGCKHDLQAALQGRKPSGRDAG